MSAIALEHRERVAPSVDATMAGSAKTLRLAYLCTEYPKVSHTFIRREIREIEARGHSVLRVAIRDSGGAIADKADREESAQTIHILSRPPFQFVAAAAVLLATRPLLWMSALRMAMSMSRASDRGILRHLAYFAEAALVTRVLSVHRIEHLHVHFGTNSAAVARLARRLGGPTYSVTIHGPDEFDSPRGFCLAEKVADATFVAAISDFCSAQVRRWTSVDHWHKIHVVRCAVSPDFFDAAVPVAEQSNVLLSIGRLSAQKGQLLLLDAVRRLLDDGVDLRLVLAGDGEMRPVVERRIGELGLQAHVEITGWIDEAVVQRRLRECRALVQPSFAEGLPVVMMEALAMQRPIIATSIAGVPELVEDGKNGWLIPAGSVEALVDAMREALSTSAARLTAMGRAGAAAVRQRHWAPSEAAQLERLFDQYVATAGGRT